MTKNLRITALAASISFCGFMCCGSPLAIAANAHGSIDADSSPAAPLAQTAMDTHAEASAYADLVKTQQAVLATERTILAPISASDAIQPAAAEPEPTASASAEIAAPAIAAATGIVAPPALADAAAVTAAVADITAIGEASPDASSVAQVNAGSNANIAPDTTTAATPAPAETSTPSSVLTRLDGTPWSAPQRESAQAVAADAQQAVLETTAATPDQTTAIAATEQSVPASEQTHVIATPEQANTITDQPLALATAAPEQTAPSKSVASAAPADTLPQQAALEAPQSAAPPASAEPTALVLELQSEETATATLSETSPPATPPPALSASEPAPSVPQEASADPAVAVALLEAPPVIEQVAAIAPQAVTPPETPQPPADIEGVISQAIADQRSFTLAPTSPLKKAEAHPLPLQAPPEPEATLQQASFTGAPAQDWRSIIAPTDKTRLANLYKTRAAAIKQAEAAIDANIPAALAAAASTSNILYASPIAVQDTDLVGSYRCKVTRLGGPAPQLVTYKYTTCSIDQWPDGTLVIEKTSGTERFVGRLWRDTDGSYVYLGTSFPEEGTPWTYNEKPEENQAGRLHRIGQKRLRLELPKPSSRSALDIIELVRK